MVTNDADFDPAPLGERNLKCEEFYRLLFPSCSHSSSDCSPRFLPQEVVGLANRSVSNTKTLIGTNSSGESLTEAADLSGSKIISTLLPACRSAKLHLVSRGSALLR
jgi:hypothetical protein